MLLAQLRAYRQAHSPNGIYLIPVNLYGPGDNFDLHVSHVIPTLIRKCMDEQATGSPSVTARGGSDARVPVLYMEDASDSIVLAAELSSVINSSETGDSSIRTKER